MKKTFMKLLTGLVSAAITAAGAFIAPNVINNFTQNPAEVSVVAEGETPFADTLSDTDASAGERAVAEAGTEKSTAESTEPAPTLAASPEESRAGSEAGDDSEKETGVAVAGSTAAVIDNTEAVAGAGRTTAGKTENSKETAAAAEGQKPGSGGNAGNSGNASSSGNSGSAGNNGNAGSSGGNGNAGKSGNSQNAAGQPQAGQSDAEKAAAEKAAAEKAAKKQAEEDAYWAEMARREAEQQAEAEAARKAAEEQAYWDKLREEEERIQEEAYKKALEEAAEQIVYYCCECGAAFGSAEEAAEHVGDVHGSGSYS